MRVALGSVFLYALVAAECGQIPGKRPLSPRITSQADARRAELARALDDVEAEYADDILEAYKTSEREMRAQARAGNRALLAYKHTEQRNGRGIVVDYGDGRSEHVTFAEAVRRGLVDPKTGRILNAASDAYVHVPGPNVQPAAEVST